MAKESGHILIVDDNNMNRLTLYRGVQQLGHTAEFAANGQEALEMVRSRPFDAMLLDIMMPVMDGFEVLERVKGEATLRDIPVIVISAEDEMDSVARGIEMGAEDFLPKPFNPVLLRARLNSSLEKKHLRDLERAYLEQEMMLRQSEKLATLGKLSAGMAHELNNPTAAAQRGAGQIQDLLARLQQAQLELGDLRLSADQMSLLSSLDQLARERAGQQVRLDPLLANEREQEIEETLAGRGILGAWDHAAALAAVDITLDDLAPVFDAFPKEQHPNVITWLSATCALYGVLGDVRQALGQITRIVTALKAYSYMDQAPVQTIDVHDALENTLVMLATSLANGVEVQRDYATDLPRIEGYGSELNQVWTNILDNAIAAVDGGGQITVRTRFDDPWVVIEFHDDGPGIPEEIQSKIFDPFFTTRPPGQGAGLGLTISHNIIVQKHGGLIAVHSQPGSTCFEVRLPLGLPT